MTDEVREIRELIDSWIAASNAGDLSALLEMMTDDVFMTPGRAPFGKAEFAADSERMKGASVEAQAAVLEIKVFGACAYVRSRIQAALRPPGGPPRRLSGYAMSILTKDADGRWRIARAPILSCPRNRRRSAPAAGHRRGAPQPCRIISAGAPSTPISPG